MACILATMLGGLGYLIVYLHLLPTQGYTLLSLLVEDIFSRTLIYYIIQILMMVILYIAANTTQRPAAAPLFHGRRRLRAPLLCQPR